MNRDLNQLFLGVIIGAVGIEVLRKKKPEVLEKIKESSKDLAKAFESVYQEIGETVKKATDENITQPKVRKATTSKAKKRKNRK